MRSDFRGDSIEGKTHTKISSKITVNGDSGVDGRTSIEQNYAFVKKESNESTPRKNFFIFPLNGGTL